MFDDEGRVSRVPAAPVAAAGAVAQDDGASGPCCAAAGFGRGCAHLARWMAEEVAADLVAANARLAELGGGGHWALVARAEEGDLEARDALGWDDDDLPEEPAELAGLSLHELEAASTLAPVAPPAMSAPLGEQLAPDMLAAMAPDAGLAALLAGVEVDAVDPYRGVEIVAAWKRVEAWAAAGAAVAAADLAAKPEMSSAGHPGNPVAGPVNGTAEELAMRLAVTRTEAAGLVRVGEGLVATFAETAQALAAGVLDWRKAATIVTTLGVYPDHVAWYVEQEVLPAAGRRTHSQLVRDLSRALLAVDHHEAERRHQRALRRAHVTHPRPLPDGMSSLYVVGGAEDTVPLDLVLTAAARAARSAGDGRSVDQLRAEALFTLAAGALHTGWIGPPDGAGPCTCTATVHDHDPDGAGSPTEAGGPANVNDPVDADGGGSADAGAADTDLGDAGGADTDQVDAGAADTDLGDAGAVDADPGGADDVDRDAADDAYRADADPDDADGGGAGRIDADPDDVERVDAGADGAGDTDAASDAGAVSEGSPPGPTAGERGTGVPPPGPAPGPAHPPTPADADSCTCTCACACTGGDGGGVGDDRLPPLMLLLRSRPGRRLGDATTNRTQVRLTLPLSVAMLPTPDDAEQVGGGDGEFYETPPLTEVAELAGYGPVTPEVARAIAVGGTWRRMVTDPLTGAVLDIGRTRYKPPADLAEHVRQRDRTCVSPGCDTPAERCQIDHTLAWSLGGTTADHNTGPMCTRDHRLKSAGLFHVTQPHPGVFEWTTPSGHAYRRDVDGTITPLPRPRPGAHHDDPPF